MMHTQCLCLPCNHSSFSIEEQQTETTCTIAYSLIFPILVSFAGLTNILNAVILIRLQTKSAPTPSRQYLFCLAVAHCLAVGPILIGTALRNRSAMSFGWAVYVAHLEMPLYNCLNCFSVYIIVGLSIDRYMAICYPHSYSFQKEFKNLPIRITIAFVIPVIIYIPLGFVYTTGLNDYCVDIEGSSYHVVESPIASTIFWKVWGISSQVVHRLAPAVTLTFININLLLTVRRLKSNRTIAMSRKSSMNRSSREKQLIQVLLALTMVFLVTNLPSAILYIIYTASDSYCEYNRIRENFRAAANCLEMSSYCCDFFLYFLMNWEYRRGLSSLYKNCKGVFSRHSSDRSSTKLDSKREDVL